MMSSIRFLRVRPGLVSGRCSVVAVASVLGCVGLTGLGGCSSLKTEAWSVRHTEVRVQPTISRPVSSVHQARADASGGTSLN